MTDILTATEVELLRRQVDRLTAELVDMQRQNGDLRELATRQDERLRVVQSMNEAAYKEAYNAAAGPHFCHGKPFGARPRPGIRDLANGGTS
ncbi:hypothetical protein ABZ791_30425 [Streptomyces huasconensis]|uniref:Uncharacterized protein n=1 Tax=Streptomyces huasconensis TaxID=1854574 RepID=A0ABV3M377_9ACTN